MALPIKKIALIVFIVLMVFGLIFTLIAWFMLRPESSETIDQIEAAAEEGGALPSSGGVASEAVGVVADNAIERPSVVVEVRRTDNAIGIFDVVTNLHYIHSLGGLLYMTDARNSLYLYRNGEEAEAMSPSRTYDKVVSIDTVTVPGLDRPYVLINTDDGEPSFVASEGATGQLPEAAQAVFAGSSQLLLADYNSNGSLVIYLRDITRAYDSSADVRVYQSRSVTTGAQLLSANERVAFLQVDSDEGTSIAALNLRSGQLITLVDEPQSVWLASEGSGLLIKRVQSGATFYDYVDSGGAISTIALPPNNELFTWSSDGAYLFTLAASEVALELQAAEADLVEEEYDNEDPGAEEPAVPVVGDELWVLDLESGREAQVTTLDEPVFADEFFYDEVREQIIYRDPQLQAIIIVPGVRFN